MEDILHKFDKCTRKPIKVLTVQTNIKEDIKSLVKSLYDYTKSEEEQKKRKRCALSELIIDEFDEEQIWQQIELQNSERWDEMVWDVANCMSTKNVLQFPVKTSAEIAEEPTKSEDEAELSNEEMSYEQTVQESEEVQKKKIKPKVKSKASIVDDKFFKLHEMENYLLREERREGKQIESDSDDESVNYFEDETLTDDENENAMYTDFFNLDDDETQFEEDDDVQIDEDTTGVSDGKRKKKVTFANDSSDDESNVSSDKEIGSHKPEEHNTDEKKSAFELNQHRLKQQIQRLEEKTLKEASWQLKGEVDASKRPQNSLMQEIVDFEVTTQPPPEITDKTTLTLEDIIKQRIKDKAWDDVVRKEKAVDDQLSFRKTEVLDHSKNKLSLAQVYEAEYLKQKQSLSGDIEPEKEPEAHTEIRDAMNKLFSKLDALTHYHYTPKAPQAEVKIVSNTPAISMEEVAPVATSEAALLAPEEVKKKHRGDMMSKEERTQTDKKRERRKKKKMQSQNAKVPKVTDDRNTKKGTEASDKSLKTSKAFFQQLNDDANSLIKKSKNFVKIKG